MQQEQYIIEGMTCLSCKRKIEKTIRALEGVEMVTIDYSKQQLKIRYRSSLIKEQELKDIVEELGYQLFTLEEMKSNRQIIALSLLLVIIAYALVERIVPDFNTLLTANQKIGYLFLFIVGLTTSFHCVSMCGGIAVSQLQATSPKQQMRRHFNYNLGRVLSYSLLGGLVGAIGSFITTDVRIFKGLPIFLGTLMVLIGLNKVGFLSTKWVLNGKLNLTLGRWKSKFGTRGSFAMGLLNGFMPCGPLQLMQLYALGTGSFVDGALSMFFFGLGTVPLMLGLGVFLSKISAYSRTLVHKIGGALIIILGLNMTISGMVSVGINIDFSFDQAPRIEAQIVDGIQLVEFDLERRRYEDIVVKVGMPVKLIINANQGTLNGCNQILLLNEFGVREELTVGQNEIFFMPSKAGTFTYSCWMGMIRNRIKVID